MERLFFKCRKISRGVFRGAGKKLILKKKTTTRGGERQVWCGRREDKDSTNGSGA